jgi:hypothetical protein
VHPNGGEAFHTNEQCTVSVTSEKAGDALIYLVLDAGRYEFKLPGLNASFDPRTDSLFVFTIPDSFADIFYNTQKHALDTTWIPGVSDSCEILIRDYNASAGYEDRSDNYFRIIP